jgi:ribose transport system substrate-binding protein
VREIAFDTNPVCVELLQKGAVSALIVQNPYAMGYLGVETAWRSLQGERFDASSLINTPTTTITRETMFTIESQKAIFSFD